MRKGLEKSISSPYRASNIVTCELYIHVSSQKLSRRLVVPRKWKHGYTIGERFRAFQFPGEVC